MATAYKNAPSVLDARQGDILPGQVANSDGAAVYGLDDFARLRRFLILGSEGGSYYASERDLTAQNTTSVQKALDTDGLRVVNTVVEISESGRAPKNDPALFVLALAASHSDQKVRSAALEALPRVARTGTHLFVFADLVQRHRGWGRALRRAVANWYERENVEEIAYQAIKYRQREGWTHRDLLRLSHPTGVTPQHKALYEWIVKGSEMSNAGVFPRNVAGFIRAQEVKTPRESAELIREYNLPREAIQTDHLNSPEVWEALLEKMPATALIRNLATMTRVGVLTPTSSGTQAVLDKLGQFEWLQKSRIHPLAVLVALKTYEQGHGFRGGNTWTPVASVVDALDEAFYAAFGNVTPTNKRWMLSLDVSASMEWGNIAGTPLTPRVASAAMAMVTARSEKLYEVNAFSHSLRSLTITPRQRLDTVLRTVSGLSFGSTNCALPMEYAIKNKREVDVFVVYTDSETNHRGARQPVTALRDYRRKTGIDAKLIVVGMVSNGFSIADPNDAGMLDVVGFDTAAPEVMSSFALGQI